MAKRWKVRLVVPVLLLILLAFGLLAIQQHRAVEPVAAPPAALPAREVTLYFVAADGRDLVAERRTLPGCVDERRCLSETVAALLQGPQGRAALPLFPAAAQVRAVTVEGGTALVDLTAAARQEHPGGSLSELLSVLGLANTVAANAAGVRDVRLLIDGQPVPTLKGHVDLRQPVPADFGRVRDGARP